MQTICYYSVSILLESCHILIGLIPYMVIGSCISEALRFFKWQTFITKVNKFPSVISYAAVTIIGMLSPLCTFGTIPIVLTLFSSGFSLSLLLVFLFTSSMMNPQLFILTAGGISLKFALIRVVVIFIFGILTGIILSFIPNRWIVNTQKSNSSLRFKQKPTPIFSLKKYIVCVLESLEFVSLYIIIGVVLGATIQILFPEYILQKILSHNNIVSVLIASVISIPTYTCGGGIIPLISSLLQNGLSVGAAIAFFNVGSTTRLPILSALLTFLKPSWILIYCIYLITFSLIIGMILK